jgi:tetratricopeptide (TPR) repeat protein
MPPWKPGGEYGEFEGDRRLRDRDIQTIRQWVEDGALKGDPRDLPRMPVFTPGWQLGRPDMVVSMPEPYIMAAAGTEIFRNFILPVPLSNRRYVRAIEFRPGNSKVVHHARILIDESRDLRRLDRTDPEPGFGGMEAPGARFPEGHFLGWVAGKMPGRDSLAWPLEPGDDLVIEMHLRPTGRPEPVQASIGLYFSDTPPSHTPVMLRMGSQTIDIPPGEPEYVVTDSYVLPVDVEALRILPHAHYLGRDMRVLARLRDGSTKTLLHIPDWDLNWQDDYEYSRPVTLPRGTELVMRYTFDNSASNRRNPYHPPRRVLSGPQATDEMAELLVQLLPKTSADLPTLRADVVRKMVLLDIAGEEKRIADVPDDYEARNALGVLYAHVGRVDEALALFEASLAARPGNAVAHYNIGVIAVSKRQIDDAVAHFTRALASRPDYVEAHTNLGALFHGQGRTNEAVAHYRQALAIRPSHLAALNNLGLAMMDRGKPDEAIRHFQESLRVRPGVAETLDRLAQAYAAAGHHDAALRTARQALEQAIAEKNEPLAQKTRLRLKQYERKGVLH